MAQCYLKHFELCLIWKSWWFTEKFWTSCSVFVAYQTSLTWRPGQFHVKDLKGLASSPKHENCHNLLIPNLHYPIWLSLYKESSIVFHTILLFLLAVSMYFVLLENNDLVSFATQWANKLVQMTWTVHMDPTGYEIYITCVRHNDNHKPEAYFFLHI